MFSLAVFRMVGYLVFSGLNQHGMGLTLKVYYNKKSVFITADVEYIMLIIQRISCWKGAK